MLKPWQLAFLVVHLAIAIGGLRAETARLQKRDLADGFRKVENFSEIVTRWGYSAEEHSVTTEDGYLLGVHRISGSPRSPPVRGKPTVLLLHGVGATSDTWVLQGPGVDLAFILADQGFDVWFMNMRGNLYSRSHLAWSPLESQFWRFSWHEGGVYDLPATIDHVLEVTGSHGITLIGHSMGTTITFALLSARPEYNKKVDLVIALAPIAGFPARNQFRSAGLAIFTLIGMDFLDALQANGVDQLFSNDASVHLLSSVCRRPQFLGFCRQVFYFVFGIPQCNTLNVNALPDVLDHYPSGMSVNTLRHFGRLFQTGDFRLYDFGPKLNLVRYGSTTPPKYPLERITAPVFLFYGPEDPFATAADVEYLEKNLVNVDVRVAKQVPHPLFSHLDFVFGLDAKQLLFDDLINIMNNFTTSLR